MSIYSGFAKRSQEQIYNRLIFAALELFSRRTLKQQQNKAEMGSMPLSGLLNENTHGAHNVQSNSNSFNNSMGGTDTGAGSDFNFAKKLLKIYKAMTYLEKSKHMEPNMSGAIHALCKFLYFEHSRDKKDPSQDRGQGSLFSNTGGIDCFSNKS